MYDQSHFVIQRMHIIQKADKRNEKQTNSEKQIMKVKKKKRKQACQAKNNPTTPYGNLCMRTPMIRLVDDIIMVCNFEINNLKKK